jgi:hypothetical protein
VRAGAAEEGRLMILKSLPALLAEAPLRAASLRAAADRHRATAGSAHLCDTHHEAAGAMRAECELAAATLEQLALALEVRR